MAGLFEPQIDFYIIHLQDIFGVLSECQQLSEMVHSICGLSTVSPWNLLVLKHLFYFSCC